MKAFDPHLALAELTAALDKATADKADDGRRRHLGASLIGRPCARHLWFVFRWAKTELFAPRMLRLFERGQLEESRFVNLLRDAGAQVWETDDDGKQFRIKDVEGHFGGSCDGVAKKVPGLDPKLACLLEFKTYNDKSFAKLQKAGLRETKPEHITQMQVYMGKLKLKIALYMAVNKDTDEHYYEFVLADKTEAEAAIRRARSIIFAEEAPPRISETPGYWQCTFCPHVGVCHLAETPEVNCRTCVHATPIKDGQWRCEKERPAIEDQSGCRDHLFNPNLLNIAELVDGDTEEGWLDLRLRGGDIIRTGAGGVASNDLRLR